MTQTLAELGRPDFTRLVTQLSEAPEWTFDDHHDTLPAARERWAESPPGEADIRLNHEPTDAWLFIHCPDYHTGTAARLTLHNTLSPNLPETDQGFIGTLQTAQRQIAVEHATANIQPIADPSLIAREQVPIDFDETYLERDLAAFTAIAHRVQRLHEDIRAPVENYLETIHPASTTDRHTDSNT